MIRVTIEMVPRGLEHFSRHMATIEIHNDVAATVASRGRKGDYIARFSRISQHGEHLGWYDRQVKVHGISRTTSGAVYRILSAALREFLGDKS